MKELKKRPIVVLIFVLILGYAILIGSGKIALLITQVFPEIFQASSYLKSIVTKLLFFIFSVSTMLLIPNMQLRDFGFRLPKKISYLKLIWQTTALTLGSFIVFHLFFNVLLRNIFGDSNGMGFPNDKTFLQRIVSVWICSSICEEILNRGLLQSLLNTFKKYKFCKLSYSIWISGIIFGLMHFSVLKICSSIFFVLFIVFGATVVGILAAYYREKSESLYPAIAVHILANISGSLPMLFFTILSKF